LRKRGWPRALLIAACACSLASGTGCESDLELTGPDPDERLPPGWADSMLVVAVGDRVKFEASRTIDMWPNCEDTKVAQGYPGIDCDAVHHVGPDGTNLFEVGQGDYPMPGAPVMALVGRVGNGPAFLIGKKATIRMQRAGRLQMIANDPDWRKDDDQGWYRVEVRAPSGSAAIAVH